MVINLETYNKTGADSERFKTSDSYRKMLVQCQKLTEENKRMQQLVEENASLKEQLGKGESTLAKSQKSLAHAQGQVRQQEQHVKELKQLQAAQLKKRSQCVNVGLQTPATMLTE